MLKISLFSFVVLLQVGCASSSSSNTSITKTNCGSMDWFEYGRRDGSKGAPKEQIDSYRKLCGNEFDSSSETLYVNGRNSGLVEYCSPQNGFEIGRMGAAYLYVCPSLMEPAFINEMRRGQRIRDGHEKARATAGEKGTEKARANNVNKGPASEKAN